MEIMDVLLVGSQGEAQLGIKQQRKKIIFLLIILYWQRSGLKKILSRLNLYPIMIVRNTIGNVKSVGMSGWRLLQTGRRGLVVQNAERLHIHLFQNRLFIII